MQNPKVIIIRHEKQVELLKSQRSINAMQKQTEQLQQAIAAEQQAFMNLVAQIAKDSKVNPKRYTFDLDKLCFVPKGKK